MRVSFFGKGGSGKTTMATSFIKYLEKKNKNILAVDADINVHLGLALQMDVKPLGDSFNEISNFFEEERIKEGRAVIGSTPPTLNSKFIKPSIDDLFFKKFSTRKNNLNLLTVGTYNENKVGYACYHSKLGSIFLVYNRLLDDENFYVISDATAGVDNVGTSMFYVSDINVFVVEPTLKSINVLKDFLNITKNYNIKTYVIGNKIEDDSDINYIKKEITDVEIIGFVPKSKNLKEFEQGNLEGLNKFIKEQNDINEKLYNLLNNTKKDWETYYKIQKEIYINDAKDWYNEYYHQDLPSYIDKNFSYEKVLKQYEISS